MTTEEVMAKMDAWVASRGIGVWVDPDKPPGCTTPIQQVRAEVVDLVDALLLLEPRSKCLEIGLGEFGGSRTLWKMLFDGTFCVEMNVEFVAGYIGREGPDIGFCIDDSLSERAVHWASVRSKYDFLHIDGNHDYWAARNDWEAYSPMVRSGGLVALHDLLTPGVSRLVDEVAKDYRVRRVVHSTHVGLAIVEVP